MKKILSLIAVIGCVSLSARAGNVPYPGILWSLAGATNVNYNAMVGATGTNTSGVLTNNAQSGIVLSAATNYFNLAVNNNGSFGVSGSQANTNYWPSVGFNLLSGYPNTYAPGANNVTFGFTGYLLATNSSSTTIVERWAGSLDNTNWITNYLVVNFVIPINSFSTNTIFTNISSGGMPYIALYDIENPSANTLSNVTVEASFKSGL